MTEISFFIKVLNWFFMDWWILYIFWTVKVRIGKNGERANIFLIIMLPSSLWPLLNSCKLNFPNKPVAGPFRIHCLSKSLLFIWWPLFLTKVTILRKFRVLRKLYRILFYESSRFDFRKYCMSYRFLFIII